MNTDNDCNAHRRFPLPSCLLLTQFPVLVILPGQLIPRQPLSNNLSNNLADSQIKTLAVAQTLPVIVAEHLLVQIAEQVKGLHADICATDAPLQKRPEVFASICVALAIHI